MHSSVRVSAKAARKWRGGPPRLTIAEERAVKSALRCRDKLLANLAEQMPIGCVLADLSVGAIVMAAVPNAHALDVHAESPIRPVASPRIQWAQPYQHADVASFRHRVVLVVRVVHHAVLFFFRYQF